MRPVLKDLSDTTLVLDADILSNVISLQSQVSRGCMTHQTLRTPVDVREVKTRIAHSRGIDHRRNLGEVLGTELVENVDVCFLELRQELDSIT